MKNYIENSKVIHLSTHEMIQINGGGILRKWGIYFGEKVGVVLIYLAVAFVTKKII